MEKMKTMKVFSLKMNGPFAVSFKDEEEKKEDSTIALNDMEETPEEPTVTWQNGKEFDWLNSSQDWTHGCYWSNYVNPWGNYGYYSWNNGSSAEDSDAKGDQSKIDK